MKQITRQILVCTIIVAIGVAIFCAWVLLSGENPLSTDYKESGRQTIIEYAGKKYQYNEHLSNYLFLGIDTEDQLEGNQAPGTAGHADAIYLVSYDRVKKTVKCISIPRDTITNIRYFAVDGTDLGYSKGHINIQYAYGDGKSESCQLMKEAIQELLPNVSIQGYCAINMDGIPIAVKNVGGVQLVVPDDSLEKENPEFKKGATVVITEQNVEQFVRYRDTQIAHSANTRTERQKVFLEAFVETSKIQARAEENFIVDMYEELKPHIVTNIGNDIFAKLLQAESELGDLFYDIPGKRVDGMNFDEYHINEEELFEMILQIFYEETEK